MAKYTLELRQLIENGVDIFNSFQYPIFSDSYKTILERRIIDHFYFREIGCETVGRFIHYLKTKMNEIMPYYNKFYETTLLDQRILDNYDVTETFTRTTDNTGNTNNQKLISDTPQGRVALTEGVVLPEFISGIEEDKTENIDQAVENWTRTMKGNIGIQTDSNAIEQYRKSLLNVDLMIINELEELFMGVY